MSNGEDDAQRVAGFWTLSIEDFVDAAKEAEKGWEKFRRMQEDNERRCDRLLSLERSNSPLLVHGDESPLDRKPDLVASTLLNEGHEAALRLARAVRLGCLSDAHDATPEDFVKEAAVQLEMVLSGGTKREPDKNDYGAIHNLVQTITLFLRTVSDETVIATAADACVKAMTYIGKEDRARKEELSGDDLEDPWVVKNYLRTEVIDAISLLCERIIQRADAPAVDSADGKVKAPKRKREEYEGEFGAGQLQSAAPAL